MPPNVPEPSSAVGSASPSRQIKVEDVDPELPLVIAIAAQDSQAPLRHLPSPIYNGSNIRPVQARPIPVINNNMITLTKEQWRAGTPWPEGSKRGFFQVSVRFRRPEVSQLINLDHYLQKHEAKVQSRLAGVTFLNPGELESNWVAGLVGLTTRISSTLGSTEMVSDLVHKFRGLVLILVVVARVAYDFFRLSNGQKLPRLPTMVKQISLARTYHRDLRAELNANPGVVIRDRRVVPVEQLGTITHHGVDPMLSYIAVLYRLLTSFPQRFPQEDDQSPKIWGFTHNNWQAALFVFRAFKKRRVTNMKSDNSPGERDSLDAIWYGTVAEQRSLRLASTRSPTAEAGSAMRDTSIAHSHQGDDHGGVNGSTLRMKMKVPTVFLGLQWSEAT